MTVVSGPNGCGKSNISDAIQFVLGQLSSKTMRSDTLSGVIFSGTKEGQKTAPHAKVTLILDNSQEPKEIPISTNEVHIGRKVYQDGRSEYYLNGSRITRTEIVDTLDICGISIDGYNVIRQGEIAKFANMSPLQLRNLFEEIAGIAAYDERKEKAEKKLEDARTKLKIASVRLEESMKNLNRLEKEKKDALRYQELKVKIKNTEAKLLHARIRQNKKKKQQAIQKIEDLKQQKEKGKETIKQMKVAIKSYDEMIEEEKNKLKNASTQTFNTITEEIEQLTHKHSTLSSERKVVENQLEDISRHQQKIREQITEINSNTRELQSNHVTTQNQLEGADKTLFKIKEELDSKREILESSKSNQLMKELEDQRALIAEKNKEKAELESQLAILNNNLNILDSRIDEKEKRIVEVAGILAQILSRKVDYVNEILQYTEDSREMEVKLEELRAELETVEEELSENENALRDTGLTIKRIQTELDTTKRIIDDILSKYKGIKLILEARDEGKIRGIYGTVGELCKTHPEYALALNITAGNRTNYVIVENDDVAEECIMLIKKAKAGRVTFLPLNKITPRVIPQHPKEKGVIGRAIDLVKFKKKYQKAIEYVFGQTIIVKDLATARKIGYEYKNRAVTLDGDLVNPSGSMTGGFYKGDVRGKINLIVKDEAKLPELQEEYEELQEERQRLLAYKRDISKELDKELMPRYNEIIRNRDLRERDLKLTQEEIDIRSEENIRIQGELEELTTEFETLEKTIEEHLEKRQNLNTFLKEAHEKEEQLKEELEKSGVQEVLEEIKEMENQQVEITKIMNNLRQEEYEAKTTISQNKKKKEELITEQKGLKQQEEEKKEKLEEIREKEQALLKQLTEKKEERTELVTIIEESQQEQEKLQTEQNDLRRQLEQNKEQQNQIIILIERYSNEKTNAEKQIEELENIATERDLPYIFAEDEEIEVEILQEVMKGLKSELEELPEINMKAISQYEEELSLNNELLEKKKFVEKDFNAIKQAIQEIENEKRSKFMNVFNSISKDFNRIFGILSPDGRAKLELDNPDDPFDGGINIMANPGGKKITSMLALSGGEKSLTALAMIFAIQRYKPAPFYIFDEIDAFLDVNNVHKVAALVREMSKDTQIMIISLRAPMIAAAQKIFGVTAGEDKISQIVTVSLDEIMKIVEKTDLIPAEVYDY